MEVKPEDKMNLPEIKIEELLSGVHFSHNVRKWNPKMENIFMELEIIFISLI